MNAGPIPSRAPSPQTQAADPSLSVFVTANAGSGKTTTLVNRVARLLLRGAAPEALLCVTYTKAAAAEMQTRLFEQLGSWAVMADAPLAQALVDIGEAPTNLPLARALFARALETPGGLKIQTIHAFCEKLLRRFPLEAGVSPNFEVLEDAAASEVSAAAREAVARHALREPDRSIGRAYAHFAVQFDLATFEGLFAAFESRREATARWLAGFQDDTAAVERHVWAQCGFPEPGDAEAFERKAVSACDMAKWAEAAEALINVDRNVLRRAGKLAGIASGSTSVKLGNKLGAVVECARSGNHTFAECLAAFSTQAGAPLKQLGSKDIDEEVRAWLEAERDRLHAACKDVQAARIARDTLHALQLARGYIAAYETEKRDAGGLDFADLIARTGQLLTERADAAWVLYKLDGGIDHVLIDEAQDTAPEQWEILRALTGEFFAGHGKRGLKSRTVFAVGDEKQSIYSFQGAAPERLLQETRAYGKMARGAGAELKQVPLLESWRSTGEVLRFVDALFADPSTRAAVPPPVGADIVTHRAGRPDDHHGCIDLWPPEQEEPAVEPDAWDAPVDAQATDGARKRLARKIAGWIKDAGARGEAVWEKQERLWRPVRPGDVLILVRRRDALFEEILRALKKAGVPVAGADRLALSEHILFQDVLALLRFVLFPGDDLSLATLLRSPLCDVPEEGEGSLMDLALGREGGLWGTLRRRADEHPAWRAALDLLDGLVKDARRLQPFEFLTRALNRTDTSGRTLRQRILTRLGREAEEALDEVLAQTLVHERRGIRDLEQLCAAFERTDVQVKRELEAAGGAVRVMTVHGAKGLEAPVVILPDTTTKPPAGRSPLLPTYAEQPDGTERPDGGFLIAPRKGEDCDASAEARASRERRTEQEAMRLLYVAVTRARDRVIVCGRIAATAKGAVKGCWYQAVEQAFERPEIAKETHIVEVGDMAVRRFGQDPKIVADPGEGTVVGAALPAWTRTAAPQDPPALAYASPSDLAERKRGPAPSPLATAQGGVGRFRRGDLIHRLLQLLPDLPDVERDEAAARLLGKELDLDPDQRAEMAEAALAVLRDPVFAEVFGPGSRAEAAIAGTAPELPPGLAISGRVDRMTVTPERVLVVDFKTNRPAPRDIGHADEAYRIQMAVYVAVLRAIFPGRRVEAALVWTDGPRLMPVPEEVIAATLASLPGRS